MDANKAKLTMEQLGRKMPTSSSSNLPSALVKGAILVGLTGYGLYNSLYNVPAGHRAILFNRLTGIQEQVIEQGTHFMLPWFDRPIIFDVRTRPRSYASLTGSRDLQMVNINIRVLSKPNRNELPWIYRRLGLNYDEVVLPSIVNEVAKQVVAQFNASQLITQRDHVSKMICRNLQERAADFKIQLDDVAITHLSFGRDYTAAVESKQVAQQDAERARFIVDKAVQDKKSTIIRAQGQAKAAELVGEAIQKNPAFIQLRRLDAAKEIAAIISRSVNKVYLQSDSLLLNLLHDANTFGSKTK